MGLLYPIKYVRVQIGTHFTKAVGREYLQNSHNSLDYELNDLDAADEGDQTSDFMYGHDTSTAIKYYAFIGSGKISIFGVCFIVEGDPDGSILSFLGSRHTNRLASPSATQRTIGL